MMKEDTGSIIPSLNRLAELKLNYLHEMLELTSALAQALADDRDDEIKNLLNLRQARMAQVDDLDRQVEALNALCPNSQHLQWQERMSFWQQEQQQVLAKIITVEAENRIAANSSLDQTKEDLKRSKQSREIYNYYNEAELPQTMPGMFTGLKLDKKE